MKKLLLAILFALYNSVAFSQTVIHGPIVQNPAAQTTTGHVIYWTDTSDPVTLDSCVGTIAEQTPGGVLQSSINGVAQANARVRRDFSLSGLTGQCSFVLRNGSAAQIDAGGTVKPFKATGESIRFGVIGDQGDEGAPQTDIANQMAALGLDFYTTTGDNTYHPDYETGMQLYPVFLQWLSTPGVRALNRISSVFPTLGNHDRGLILNAFATPGNSSRYSFETGDALIVGVFTYGGSVSDTAYAQWIDQQLTNSTKTFKFVFGHYPGTYECGSFNDTYSATLQKNWVPIFEKHKAIYIAGHHHNLQVWWPAGDEGAKYIITGGGAGASTGFASTCPNPQPTYKAQVAHFLDVQIVNKVLTVRAVGRTGQVYGTWTLDRSGQEPPPPPPPPQEEFGTYLASDGFSGTQGPRWFYLEAPSLAPMAFESANNRWKGSETYSLIWSGSMHPGAEVDSVRRFVIPGSGDARITGTVARTGAGPGSVKAIIKRNGVEVWSSGSIGQNQSSAHDVTVIGVAQGDVIDFQLNDDGTGSSGNYYDSTSWDPTVEVTEPPPPPPPPPPPAETKVRVEPRKIQSWFVKGIADEFDLALSQPRPKAFPKIDAPSFQGSGAGHSASQWTIDPLNQGSITPLFHGTPTLCHRRDGSVYSSWTYYQNGNTAEEAFKDAAHSWLIFEGPRNFNAVSPYVTFRADGKGFWGIDLSGWVFYLHDDGRVGSAHGPTTLVKDGKIFCGERKFLGTADIPLKMPIDLALWPGNHFRQLIADTGNKRIAELNIQHGREGTTSQVSTFIGGFVNIYSLDIHNGKVYAADAGAGHIKECDLITQVCRVLATAFDAKWLRVDSKGQIVYLSNSPSTLYSVDPTTGVTTRIARLHSTIENGDAWKWCYIDIYGTLGAVDTFRCTASQTTPGTINVISRDGAVNFIYNNGGPRNSGRLVVPGVGNLVRDSAQHYGWAIEGSPVEAKFVVTGFGSTGIGRYRRIRTNEPKLWNNAAWQSGKNAFQFGNTSVPSGTLFHGPFGFGRLGLPNFDDIVDMPADEQDAYIRGGFGLSKWWRPTEQQIKDMKYFICKESYKGHIQECPY